MRNTRSLTCLQPHESPRENMISFCPIPSYGTILWASLVLIKKTGYKIQLSNESTHSFNKTQEIGFFVPCNVAVWTGLHWSWMTKLYTSQTVDFYIYMALYKNTHYIHLVYITLPEKWTEKKNGVLYRCWPVTYITFLTWMQKDIQKKMINCNKANIFIFSLTSWCISAYFTPVNKPVVINI